MSDTRTRIVDVIRRVSRENSVPGANDSLFDSGLLDSFTLPEMITALEEEFGLRIPDSDMLPINFDSIAVIESYLASR